MLKDRDFLRLTLADLIVRSAYQMGKTPLLPIFAAALGASDILLGFIVSISTLTGMLTKPIIGLLSDRWGRHIWLLIGTAFFGLVPFTYWLVKTPEDLVIVRVIHGMATAIYGPVTLAWVAEQSPIRRAERIAWFSNARSIGYIIGPALGGLLLLWLSPQMIFTLIGLASCAAFLPIIHMGKEDGGNGAALSSSHNKNQPQYKANAGTWLNDLLQAFQSGFRTPAIWLAGWIEALTYVALYALKAFLPIYALQIGFNSAEIGSFFAVQEAANIIAKPLGGRLSDRIGNRAGVTIGMLGVAAVLPAVAFATTWWQLLILAALLGIFQGILFPTTTALIAQQMPENNLGTGMGLVGMLQNGGKVAGPIIGGLLLRSADFKTAFILISAILAAGAILLIFSSKLTKNERAMVSAD